VKSVDAHLEGILRAVAPLPPLPLPLADAHNCVLAEDVVASFPLPSFDNSAMDGYAVRAADLAQARPDAPIVLPVVADIAAGSSADVHVQPGVCARIMTGAPLPSGADAIVPQEDTDQGHPRVRIMRAPQQGQHVRWAGEDLPAGGLVLSAGTYLGAPQIGLLAAAGRATLLCRPRPRAVVISTGSELVEAGEPLGRGQIHDSNSHLLTAAAREAGAMAFRVGVVPDDHRRLLDTLEDHLIRADLVITSGGVSVGAYDVTKEVLSRLGTVAFDKVAMQPGMPQGFGHLGAERTPIFTLPGNPVSAMVSFEVFVRPAIRRMLGAQNVLRPQVTVQTTETVRSSPGKRSFLRAVVEREPGGRLVARQAGGQGSHVLSSMAAANALLVVPEQATEVAAGASLTALLLERRSG